MVVNTPVNNIYIKDSAEKTFLKSGCDIVFVLVSQEESSTGRNWQFSKILKMSLVLSYNLRNETLRVSLCI